MSSSFNESASSTNSFNSLFTRKNNVLLCSHNLTHPIETCGLCSLLSHKSPIRAFAPIATVGPSTPYLSSHGYCYRCQQCRRFWFHSTSHIIEGPPNNGLGNTVTLNFDVAPLFLLFSLPGTGKSTLRDAFLDWTKYLNRMVLCRYLLASNPSRYRQNSYLRHLTYRQRALRWGCDGKMCLFLCSYSYFR
jgi:hypothetical protein